MTSQKIPDTLANRYKIIEKLGAGGMGVVFLANDPVLNLNVAIKLLSSDPTGMTAARLQREAMAAGKLNHPNIAKVYDFGQTTDGSPYMVMEYVQGESLADLISRRGHLTSGEAVKIFVQILQGLSIAHSHKIIHRDLKPSNIMVVPSDTNEQQIKLLDFGIAKLNIYNQELTSTGVLLGSPIYMSPEQAQGDEADSRSDIYSFGCLMFESLTGQPPFKGNTALETISMHKSKAPPLVTEVLPNLDISQELVNLIDSCLSKSPQSRPQNCNDLLEKLKAESEPMPKRQTVETLPQVERLEPKTVMGMSPLLVVLGALFIFCLAVFAYVMINASIKTSLNKRENEVIAKANSSQTGNTGLGGEHGEALMNGLGIHQSNKNGNPTVKAEVALEDDDLSLYKNAKRVDFSDINLTRNQLIELSSLPIESLQLRGQEVDDDSVRLINKMKSLKSLHLKNTFLTNKGLRALNNLVGLESLKLGCPLITADGLANLSGLVNLTTLEINGDRLGDETPLYLSKLANLKTLEISSKSFTDKGFSALKKLPKLQNLTVSSSPITDRALCLLKEMENLQAAHFERCNFSKDFGRSLQPGKKLTGLSFIGQRPFSVASAEALANTNICTLNLQGSSVFDEQLIAISKMKRLSTLNIEGAPVSIKGISSLKSPPLQSFSFKNYLSLDNAMVKKISKLKELKSLELAHTNVNDKQLIMLSCLGKLESLNLNGCPALSSEAIEEFQKSFMSLNHRRCRIHQALVVARDVQETENFEKGKKDWRVDYEEKD